MPKKKPAASVSNEPKSFTGLLKGRTKPVRELAHVIRDVVLDELPDAEESFYGGNRPMAMYRTTAEVCWIQPLKDRCNLYFLRGPDLTNDGGLLEGGSDHHRHVKIRSVDHLHELPVREWLRETVQLNAAAVSDGMSYDDVLEELRSICLALPQTKETLTWGKPHFRVQNKIFCGCFERQGSPRLWLKTETNESRVLLTLPGIDKPAYTRPNDGWVGIDPNVFDNWDEIERLIVGSYRLIAPKKTLELLDGN